MNPIIERLKNTLFTGHALGIDNPNPVSWTFSNPIKSLGPDFYRKIIPSHMILNMEYSLLGQQIRTNLSGKQPVSEELLVEQLVAAIFLAELLEQVYQHYLVVPREVKSLREQQKLYRDILAELQHQRPIQLEDNETDEPEVGMSWSREVRRNTVHINLYRLLLVRSKRVLDLIAALDYSADWYRQIIGHLDCSTDPFLPHLGFLFYVPRLVVNLGLLIKHLVPGGWMGAEEKELGWMIRFQGQMLRRWFELGNDVIWVGLGFANGYLLTGALAPIGVYLSIAFFGYDAVLSALRAYIELSRVYELRRQYHEMLQGTDNKVAIEQHLQALDKQINAELLRLISHVITTTAIFLAMGCGAPLFAANPAIALAGALCLVLICLVNFALVPIINHCTPNSSVELPSGGIKKFGFFANKEVISEHAIPEQDNTVDGNCPKKV